MRNRGDRSKRRDTIYVGRSVGMSMGNVKMTIPQFKGRSDPEAYLAWEEKIELAFGCHIYPK